MIQVFSGARNVARLSGWDTDNSGQQSVYPEFTPIDDLEALMLGINPGTAAYRYRKRRCRMPEIHVCDNRRCGDMENPRGTPNAWQVAILAGLKTRGGKCTTQTM